MSKIRVLAVDDSETFLRGLEILLATEVDLELAGVARSGAEAVTRARRLQPDVVLMDLRLAWDSAAARAAQEDGLRAIREMAEHWPQMAIVVISSFSERRWVALAMDAGAKGFLPKEAPPEAIMAAVRTAAGGGVVLTPEQFGWLRNPAEPLTGREKEVLALLAQGQSDKEMAHDLGITVGTASKHVENIREKLGASSRGEAVARAREQGLI
jgi:DNA-binding NarL/FixJ family response regulator